MWWWSDFIPEGAATALFVMAVLGITRMMQEGSGRPVVGQEVTLGSGGGLGARQEVTLGRGGVQT